MNRKYNFKDLTGQRFGHLTVISIDEKKSNEKHKIHWLCRCDCGKMSSPTSYQLNSGKSKTCGCKKFRSSSRNGKSFIQSHKRLYDSYCSMMRRCFNPSHAQYHLYGGRGISVCPEWKNNFKKFAEWSLTHGYSDNLTIDRIDNSKGYSPDNCRWATILQQCSNRRTNVYYTHNGEKHSLAEWCRILDINYNTAKMRRLYAKKNGIEPTFEYVLSKPKRHLY